MCRYATSAAFAIPDPKCLGFVILIVMGIAAVLIYAVLAMIGYSVAWEAVRLAGQALHARRLPVRLLVQVLSFVAVIGVWPLALLVVLIVYRTPWPVSRGRLRASAL